MYQDAKGEVIEDASVLGYRAIATPGSVAGLVYAERKYGKLGLKRVMAPAIKLAAEGFTLTEEEAKELTDADLAKFAASQSGSSSGTGIFIRRAKHSGSRSWRGL